MATVAQVKQELLDFYNKEVRDWNEEHSTRYGEADEAETFESALTGYDIDGLYTYLDDGVDIPSGRAKKVKEWGDGDYGVTAVFSVGDQFFKLTGSYSSWDGYDWYGDMVEVFPKEEVKIRYYEKK
jgi:hypothetical protein